MTITTRESELLAERDLMDNGERFLVESTLNHFDYIAKTLCIPVANDDRSARLEAAVVRLIIESRRESCNNG